MNRLRFLIPNAITGTSLLLGFGSIVCTGSGEFAWAAWLIVWCVLLDVLDGISARLLKATSEFGADFDSFSDLVAFGLAPALLVLNVISQSDGVAGSWWYIAACALYVLLASIRLAIFNCQHATQTSAFRGIPTTVCGALVALGIILSMRYGIYQSLHNWSFYFALLIVILSLSMVSQIRFARLALPSDRFVSILYMANIAGMYACGFLRLFPEYLLCGLLLLIATGLVEGAKKTAAS